MTRVLPQRGLPARGSPFYPRLSAREERGRSRSGNVGNREAMHHLKPATVGPSDGASGPARPVLRAAQRGILPRMTVTCPICSVAMENTPDGWTVRGGPCPELIGTSWGYLGEYQWCPILSDAAPADVALLAPRLRPLVESEIAKAKKKRQDAG
jgi:hypothetical protein